VTPISESDTEGASERVNFTCFLANFSQMICNDLGSPASRGNPQAFAVGTNINALTKDQSVRFSGGVFGVQGVNGNFSFTIEK
jgi:hypothetical protein